MKFTIEIEDFWLEEGEVSASLTREITRSVVDTIHKSIEKKVDDAVRISVQEKIERDLTLQINLRVAELIASGIIIRDKTEISIADYIKQQFSKNSGWNSPYEQIEKIAKEYGQEMKKRYDYFYANKIVQQMHTIGILKEEVCKNLIGEA